MNFRLPLHCFSRFSKITFIFAFCCACLTGTASALQAFPGKVTGTAAIRLWNKRSRLQNACTAYHQFKQEFINTRGRDALEKTLRACYWCTLLMEYKNLNPQIREKELRECLKYAKEGKTRYPREAFTHFWTAVIEGAIISIKGFSWTALKYASELKSSMKKAMKLQPDYYYYGPYRMWGKIILYMPRSALMLLGESIDHAVELLEYAARKEPRYLMNQVYYADALRRKGQKQKAIRIYARVLTTPPDVLPEEVEENRVMIERAKEKLSSLQKNP